MHSLLVFFHENKLSRMGKYIQPKRVFGKLSNSLTFCCNFWRFTFHRYFSFRGWFRGYSDRKLTWLIKTYTIIISFRRKKYFSPEITSRSEKLNIFAGINFCKCCKIKYFAVPSFFEFAKKFRNHETLFFKSFLL